MRRTTAVIFGALFSVLLCVGPAAAQKVNKSTLTGTLTSASVAVPDDGALHTVLTTPAATTNTFFVLTQFCATTPGFPGAVNLSGNTFGQVVVSTSDECTTYVPAIRLPAGETLSCKNGNGGAGGGTGSTEQCMVTGIITK